MEISEGGSQKRKRPRIKVDMGNIAPTDIDTYIGNLSSAHAKHIHMDSIGIQFEIWFDKHFYDRQTFGDESGKRHGLETENVVELVKNTLPHLVHYGLNVKNFSFLTRDSRIVLQTDSSDALCLNIVIQIHHKSFEDNIYELTVITGMCGQNFKIAEGQYIIELIEPQSSILKRIDNSQKKEILRT